MLEFKGSTSVEIDILGLMRCFLNMNAPDGIAIKRCYIGQYLISIVSGQWHLFEVTQPGVYSATVKIVKANGVGDKMSRDIIIYSFFSKYSIPKKNI